jgi:hypothetical protein
MIMIAELSVEKLRKRCNPQGLGCASSAEVGALQAIIGQERAVRALRFGLGIKEKGFNIYVNGLPGTGRTLPSGVSEETASKRRRRLTGAMSTTSKSTALRRYACLPGRRLTSADIENLSASSPWISTTPESEEYAADREQTVKTFAAEDRGFGRLNQEAQNEGFLLKPTPMGLISVPARGQTTDR